jgi:DNA-binding MarR family transcriptional regulator
VVSSRARLDERIALLMQELISSAVLTNERIARRLGLNVVDFQTYGVLVRAGEPMTPGRLAAITELPSSTTTRVLDRLETKGLVRREADASDRRKTWVHAIPFEHPETGAAYASIMRQLEEVHRGFSVAELKTVIRYLDSVKDVR